MTGTVALVAVEADEADLRLDRWFRRRFPALPHSRLEKLLRTGQVRVDGRRAKAGDRLAPGQTIRVPPLGAEPREASEPVAPRGPHPADIRAVLDAILHRDDDVIAINKPAGLAVQGGTGTERHIDGLLDELRFDADERPRLVHRLDKETSGVLLIARTVFAAAKLTAAFREKTARKIYFAALVGVPKKRQGRIDLALGRSESAGRRIVADEEDGKRAVTAYSVVEHVGTKAAFAVLSPVTGRTHQLRVHMASIGTPILGDGRYGGREASLDGAPNPRLLHLHARRLVLPHPRGGTLDVTAPLSPELAETWRFFGFSEAEGDDTALRDL